jgi:Domain of unknown function (DUF5597)/Beta-galactosidase
MKTRSAVLGALAATLVVATLYAQVEERPLPRLVQKDGRFALFVDDAPFLILGVEDQDLGLESSWPLHPKDWAAMEYLHANTIEIPIYWDQIEPQPGKFDYASIDRLLTEARQHNVRLILLWFATWKNGSQHYMPEWMLLDPGRYSHMINRNGQAVDSPSPFATASLEADKRAFAAVLGHLKDADPQRTVIMVQVENEPGSWQSVRDFSPAAQKFFEAPVPPEILKAMHVKTASSSPTWQEAFGPDADEYFNAWSVAKYIGQVAAAGKAVYPVPMDVNAALRNPFHPGPAGEPGAPGSYESGGPTDNVLAIWKAAAPAIDILAPDDYQGDPAAYVKDLELYHRDDNALFLPESGCFQCDPASGDFTRYFFTMLGLQAIGDSESGNEPVPYLARNFVLVGPMQRELARLSFEGKLKAVAEPMHFKGGDQGDPRQTLLFGSWNAVVTYGSARFGPSTAGSNPTPEGRALVAQLGDNQFLVAGYFCTVDFFPAGTEQQRKSQHIVEGTGQTPSALIDGKWQHRQFLRVEQGIYENGVFKLLRTQNGDATDFGLRFGEEPVVLRVTLGTY